MPARPFHVLFLCVRNATRSIFAEAIVNRDGRDGVKAFSAGLTPAATVEPQAVALLQRLDFATAALHTKGWDAFTSPRAPRMDAVITLWLDPHGGTCPALPGQPATAHWNIPETLPAGPDDTDIRRAYAVTFARLERRIGMLLSLPLATLDPVFLKHRLDEIGEMTDAD